MEVLMFLVALVFWGIGVFDENLYAMLVGLFLFGISNRFHISTKLDKLTDEIKSLKETCVDVDTDDHIDLY